MENKGKSVHQARASTWSFFALLPAVIEGSEINSKESDASYRAGRPSPSRSVISDGSACGRRATSAKTVQSNGVIESKAMP